MSIKIQAPDWPRKCAHARMASDIMRLLSGDGEVVKISQCGNVPGTFYLMVLESGPAPRQTGTPKPRLCTQVFSKKKKTVLWTC